MTPERAQFRLADAKLQALFTRIEKTDTYDAGEVLDALRLARDAFDSYIKADNARLLALVALKSSLEGEPHQCEGLVVAKAFIGALIEEES